MAKELPYFRFTVQDWQNGKITLESYELQGLFISVCGYYWINDCNVSLTTLFKRFSPAQALLKQLLELGIIKHNSETDEVEIDFLNEQYNLLSGMRKSLQLAGSKGGRAASKAKALIKHSSSYKDKDKDNNKDKDNIYSFADELVKLGFEKELVKDWMRVRKTKKATNTKTALESFLKQVQASGKEPNEVLRMCVERSWSGFKSEWLNSGSTEKPDKLDNFINQAQKGIGL